MQAVVKASRISGLFRKGQFPGHPGNGSHGKGASILRIVSAQDSAAARRKVGSALIGDVLFLLPDVENFHFFEGGLVPLQQGLVGVIAVVVQCEIEKSHHQKKKHDAKLFSRHAILFTHLFRNCGEAPGNPGKKEDSFHRPVPLQTYVPCGNSCNQHSRVYHQFSAIHGNIILQELFPFSTRLLSSGIF